MKCADCGNEIAWARRCPYCGHKVSEEERKNANLKHADSKGERRGKNKHGQMRGRVNRGEARTGHTFLQTALATWRYFRDPAKSWWRKAGIVFGVLYVFSPIDLFPEIITPLFFLDDVFVASITWRLLQSELQQYFVK